MCSETRSRKEQLVESFIKLLNRREQYFNKTTTVSIRVFSEMMYYSEFLTDIKNVMQTI